MTTRPLIGYVRVSTATQGKSGLGIEAQQEALTLFAQAEGFELVRVFVEVETGQRQRRLGTPSTACCSPCRGTP